MAESGGLMFVRYANADKSYLLRFDICDFDASTFAYTGAGPKTPTESDVGATFAAFARVWAPYYTGDWLLTLESLWQTDGVGSKSQLSTVPAVAPVLGSHGTAVVPDPPLRRMYSLRNALAHYYRFNLRELIATQIGTARTATATSGGFDSRDQMLIGYLSSPATGIVLWDGEAINPSMRVSTRFDVTPYGDALGTGVTGGGGVTAALPAGEPGSILIETHDHWHALPPGTTGQVLELAPSGGELLPQWTKSCCGDVGRGLPTTTPVVAPGGAMLVPTRCGAAEAMAAYLQEYYGNVRDLLNGAASRLLGLGVAALAALLVGAAPGVLEMGGVLGSGQLVRLAVLLVSSGLKVSICPPFDGAMASALVRAFFCALPPGPGPLLVDDGVRATWCAAITASSLYTQLAAPVLVLLSQAVSLSAWQNLANLGTQQPSGGCATMACGQGRAIRGSAEYGALLRRALQGGAVYGALQRRSITGGAHYGAATARAVQGGATT